MAKMSNRSRDVYVGVDVWGRQTSGGGGFNCGHVRPYFGSILWTIVLKIKEMEF